MSHLSRYSSLFSKSIVKGIGCRPKLSVQVCRTSLSNNIRSQCERQLHTVNNLEFSSPTYSKTNLVTKRYKNKRTRQSKDEDDEEDYDNDDLSGENPLLVDDLLDSVSDGGEEVTIDCGSLRVDSFCKTAFKYSRAKIEELFYKGDIYVNGERPAKKSIEVSQGDEIDIVKHICPDDSNMVVVNRALLVFLPDKATENGRMKLQIKKWQGLTIEAHGRSKGGD